MKKITSILWYDRAYYDQLRKGGNVDLESMKKSRMVSVMVKKLIEDGVVTNNPDEHKCSEIGFSCSLLTMTPEEHLLMETYTYHLLSRIDSKDSLARAEIMGIIDILKIK